MAYPWRGGRARVWVPVASHPPSLAAPLLRRSFLFQTPCKKDGQDRAQKLKRRQAECRVTPSRRRQAIAPPFGRDHPGMSGAGTMRASGSTALVVSAREVVETSGGRGTQAARQVSPVPSLLACRRPEALIF